MGKNWGVFVVVVFPVKRKLFHRITRRASQRPMHGDCGVAWFVWVEMEVASWVFNSHLCSSRHGKIQPCPQQGQSKSQCPEFLLHVKVQSSAASGQLSVRFQLQSTAVRCAEVFRHAPGAHMVMDHRAARATWPQRESVWVHQVSAGNEREREREKERNLFFIPWGLNYFGFGMDQVAFQKDQSTSQAFAGFGWVYNP